MNRERLAQGGEQPTANPTVDVVICTNRNSPYLRDAIDSVIAQTWGNWRLIIVDDGSPWPVPHHLDRLVETIPGARVIHQEATGLPGARNAGVRAGRGDLVAFLDDDDVWHPERLSRQLGALNGRPESLGVYSGGWYMGSDGMPWGDGWPAIATPSSEFLDGTVALPRIVTLTVRRFAWLLVGGFDERYSLAEDIDFILKLVCAGELVAASGQLVGYRRHELNMTNAPLVDGRRAVESVLRNQIAGANSHGRSLMANELRRYRRAYRKAAAPESVGALIAAARRRDWRTFRRELFWALTRAPIRTATAALTRVRVRVRTHP